MNSSEVEAIRSPDSKPTPRVVTRRGPRGWIDRVARRFPRNPQADEASTIQRFEATRAELWQSLLFFEEMPHRPPWLLRLFLPMPIRTEGNKTRVGDRVRCLYEGGFLIKVITACREGYELSFEVVEQELGVEGSVTLGEGSYRLEEEVSGECRMVLTTAYRGHLRPRWLFRPFERWLVSGLHGFVLDGMSRSLRRQPG